MSNSPNPRDSNLDRYSVQVIDYNQLASQLDLQARSPIVPDAVADSITWVGTAGLVAEVAATLALTVLTEGGASATLLNACRRLYQAGRLAQYSTAGVNVATSTVQTAANFTAGDRQAAARQSLAGLASGLSLFGVTRFISKGQASAAATRSLRQTQVSIESATRVARAARTGRLTLATAGKFLVGTAGLSLPGAVRRLGNLEHYFQTALKTVNTASFPTLGRSLNRVLSDIGAARQAYSALHGFRHGSAATSGRTDGIDGTLSDYWDLVSCGLMARKGAASFGPIAQKAVDALVATAVSEATLRMSEQRDRLMKEYFHDAALGRSWSAFNRLSTDRSFSVDRELLLIDLNTVPPHLAGEALVYNAYQSAIALEHSISDFARADDSESDSGFDRLLLEGTGSEFAGDVARGLRDLIDQGSYARSAYDGYSEVTQSALGVGISTGYNSMINGIRARFRILEALGVWSEAQSAILAPRPGDTLKSGTAGSGGIHDSTRLRFADVDPAFESADPISIDPISIASGLLNASLRHRAFKPYAYATLTDDSTANSLLTSVAKLSAVNPAYDRLRRVSAEVMAPVVPGATANMFTGMPRSAAAFSAVVSGVNFEDSTGARLSRSIDLLVASIPSTGFTQALINYLAQVTLAESAALETYAQLDSIYSDRVTAAESAASASKFEPQELLRPSVVLGRLRPAWSLPDKSGSPGISAQSLEASPVVSPATQKWFIRRAALEDSPEGLDPILNHIRAALDSMGADDTPDNEYDFSDIVKSPVMAHGSFLAKLEFLESELSGASNATGNFVKAGRLAQFVTLALPRRVVCREELTAVVVDPDGKSVLVPTVPCKVKIRTDLGAAFGSETQFASERSRTSYIGIDGNFPLSSVLIASALSAHPRAYEVPRDGFVDIVFGLDAYQESGPLSPTTDSIPVTKLERYGVAIPERIMRQARAIATAATLMYSRSAPLIAQIRAASVRQYGSKS